MAAGQMGDILASPLEIIIENPRGCLLNGDMYTGSLKITACWDFQRTHEKVPSQPSRGFILLGIGKTHETDKATMTKVV